jgi:hypothetical protein
MVKDEMTTRMFNHGLLEINDEEYNFPRVNVLLRQLGNFDYGQPYDDNI